MFKLVALALASLMIVTEAPPLRHAAPAPSRAVLVGAAPPPIDAGEGPETLVVVYTPLASTSAARLVGFGTAHHMALVYTDAAGRSFGASSGPSDLATAQTPGHAFEALLAAAGAAPSTFGTLVADPRNNTPFVAGGPGDYYTRDAGGHAYPFAVVARGRDLSARWAAILATYARLGAMGLPYSPISQNSNSLAAAALRRAGIEPRFSAATPFAPGLFTQLPGA